MAPSRKVSALPYPLLLLFPSAYPLPYIPPLPLPLPVLVPFPPPATFAVLRLAVRYGFCVFLTCVRACVLVSVIGVVVVVFICMHLSFFFFFSRVRVFCFACFVFVPRDFYWYAVAFVLVGEFCVYDGCA